jgi:hypothetical protein
MIRITKLGTIFSGSQEDVASLRQQLDREQCIRLPKYLDSELVPLIQPLIDCAEFKPESYDRVGSELHMMANPVWDLLHFLANDPQLFRFVRRVTGCDRIGCFFGRVYRMLPGPSHSFVWHDDMVGDRMLAMSINLSIEAYSGGVLEIRDRKFKQVVYRAAQLAWGEALLFKIGDHLEHRVTPVEGPLPKTAFAGWFQSQPDFHGILRERRSSLERQRIETPPDPLGRALARPD